VHKLLARQWKRHVGGPPEDRPDLAAFLSSVNVAYEQFDRDRLLLERSIDISSKELLEANRGLQSMVKAWPDFHFRLRADGTVQEVLFHEALNLPRPLPRLIGRPLHEAFESPSPEALEKAIAEAAASHQIQTAEIQCGVCSLDRFYEARIVPSAPGELMAIVRDITDRKRWEKAAVESAKLSAMGRLAGGVAHEINNPLGIILGFAQALKEQWSAEESIRYPLAFIEKEVLRCKALVQNLLIYTRKSKPEEREALDLSRVTEEALTLVMAQGRVKDVELVRNLKSDVPVWGNKNQIQQIVLNLCNNAMDAMAGGGTLTVTTERIALGDRPGGLLAVADTGTGVPEAIRSKIFEPFFTTKEVGRGTGLGLALVHEIVQNHSGEIALTSVEGAGTTFFVRIPAGETGPGE
jgi:signal transduction histidine kinase